MFGRGIRDVGFEQKLAADDERRRLLARAMFQRLQRPLDDHRRLWAGAPRFLLPQDTSWLIEQLRAEPDPTHQRALAQIIGRVWDWSTEQATLIWEAAQNSPTLADEFDVLMHGIALDSDLATRLREWQREEAARRAPAPLLDPPPAARIAAALDRFEAGDREAFWWNLLRDLSLRPDSTHYEESLAPDITELPGWQSGDSELRERLVAAATRYVVEIDDPVQLVSALGTYEPPAVAGYKALYLLAKAVPERLSNLSAAIWAKWAGTIVDYPGSGGTTDRGPERLLVAAVWLAAPDAVLPAVLRSIDQDDERSGYPSVLSRLEGISDRRLGAALAGKVTDAALKPTSMGQILDATFRLAPDFALSSAERYVALPLPTSGAERERALVAAHCLVLHTDNAGWPLLWPMIEVDAEFGRALINRVAEGALGYGRKIARKLGEAELTALYLWIERNFPPAPPRQSGKVTTTTPRHRVELLHSEILAELRERGTALACTAIRSLIRELPGHRWLTYTLAAAETGYRIQSWQRPNPRVVLDLARRADARLVETVEQLLDVLAASLARLQASLQGKPGAAQFLWNKLGKDIGQPKDEESLSDYVKLHLDQDVRDRGIVVNREVQLRRRVGEEPGERTDILVQAAARGEIIGSRPLIGVVIEVKGCWNTKLLTAMEEQLAARYLAELPNRGGLYLVGWYDCGAWSHAGKPPCSHRARDELRRELDQQAVCLHRPERPIRACVLDVSLR